MRRIFRICDFENAIICGKICDLHFLPKYAIAYAIAYPHITSIPISTKKKSALISNGRKKLSRLSALKY